ncbi:MAG: holo-ACP synthase [Candidatus Midichloria sp.]|nr:MAG: holo-ACP synthase [Candidatus Midichloria sp.]
MIISIGCDIVKISRISDLLKKYGISFKKKVFTEKEINSGERLDELMQASYYAKRFAAKEAFSKALGTGIGDGISFLDIEVTNNELGAPKIDCKKLDNKLVHISLSDEQEFAIAYAIIEERA